MVELSVRKINIQWFILVEDRKKKEETDTQNNHIKKEQATC